MAKKLEDLIFELNRIENLEQELYENRHSSEGGENLAMLEIERLIAKQDELKAQIAEILSDD